MTIFGRIIFGAESFFVFGLLLIPPFLCGGIGPLPTLIIQSFVLVAFGFPVSRTLLYPSPDKVWFRKYSHVMLPLLTGILFFVYVLVQVFGGASALSYRPGSLAPFATTDHLRQLTAYVMLLVVFFGFFASRERVNMAILVIAIQITLLIAIGYAGLSTDAEKNPSVFDFLNTAKNPGHYATFINPNHFGGFIVFAQPLLIASIAYFLKARDDRFELTPDTICRIFFALLIPMALCAALSAEARMAFFWQLLLMVALIGGIVFRRPIAVLAAGVVFGGVAIYYVLKLPYLHANRLSLDLADRLQITADGYKAFLDFPWFGAGLGSSPYFLGYYQTIDPENFLLVHPSNHFLQLATETGIVGSLLFLIPVASYIGFAYKLSRKSESRWRRIFGLAAFLALALSAAPALIDNYLATPACAILALFYAALLGRCAMAHESPETAMPHPARKRPPTGRLVIVAALWIGIILTTTVLWSDYRVQRVINAPAKDGRQLEIASRLRADNAEVWERLGHWHYNEAVRAIEQGRDPGPELEVAVYNYYCAVVRAPSWAPGWIGLSKAEALSSNLELASRYLSFGVGLTPHNRDKIIYGILVQLKLAQRSLWRDEVELFERRAAYWVGVGSVLPRPLRSDDVYYLLNNAPAQLEGEQKKLVASFVSRCYRIPSKRLTS